MNYLGLTRRERIALLIFTALTILFLFIPQQRLNEWEYVYLLCFATPFIFWLILDPERRK